MAAAVNHLRHVTVSLRVSEAITEAADEKHGPMWHVCTHITELSYGLKAVIYAKLLESAWRSINSREAFAVIFSIMAIVMKGSMHPIVPLCPRTNAYTNLVEML